MLKKIKSARKKWRISRWCSLRSFLMKREIKMTLSMLSQHLRVNRCPKVVVLIDPKAHDILKNQLPWLFVSHHEKPRTNFSFYVANKLAFVAISQMHETIYSRKILKWLAWRGYLKSLLVAASVRDLAKRHYYIQSTWAASLNVIRRITRSRVAINVFLVDFKRLAGLSASLRYLKIKDNAINLVGKSKDDIFKQVDALIDKVRLTRSQAMFYVSKSEQAIAVATLPTQLHTLSTLAKGILNQLFKSSKQFELSCLVFEQMREKYIQAEALPSPVKVQQKKWCLTALTGLVLCLGMMLSLGLFYRYRQLDAQYEVARISLSQAGLPRYISDVAFWPAPSIRTLLFPIMHERLVRDYLPKLKNKTEASLVQALRSQNLSDIVHNLYLLMALSQPARKLVLSAYAQKTQSLFKLPFTPCQLNEKLITKAQIKLDRVPLAVLIWQLFESDYKSRNSVMAKQYDLISSLYRAKGFRAFQSEWQIILRRLRKNEWVLGHPLKQKLALVDESVLKNQLKTIYWHNAQIAWNRAVEAIHLPIFDNLDQARSTMVDLIEGRSGSDKSLRHLLMELKQFPRHWFVSDDAVLLEHHFKRLGAFLQNKQKNVKIKEALKPLFSFIDQLSSADKPGFAAYNAFKIMIKTNKSPFHQVRQAAKKFMMPYRKWLIEAANQTEVLGFDLMGEFLLTKARQLTGSDYQKNLARLYPFNIQSSKEAPVAALKAYFGMNGLMSQFKKKWMDSLTQGQHWQQLHIAGQLVRFPSTLSKVLIRADGIRSMLIRPSKLDICITNLSPHIASVTIWVGKMPLHFIHGPNQCGVAIYQLGMPISVGIKDERGLIHTLRPNTPWSGFKLLGWRIDNLDQSVKSRLKLGGAWITITSSFGGT